MQIELHPAARAELRDAAIWYEARESELGDAFVAAVFDAIDRAAEMPGAHPAWPNCRATPTVHRTLVQRFPYAIAYRTTGETLSVLAVAHVRRRPLYWLARVE